MVNIDKHIQHWKDGAAEDVIVARQLIESNRIRHDLFFAHLSVEILLKAHVCKTTGDIAPKTHNLVRLVEISKIELSQSQIEVFADLNTFQIEGRYPDHLAPAPDSAEALKYLSQAEAVMKWLTRQL